MEMRIVFDHYKGQFRARFVRLRERLTKSHIDKYKDLKREISAERIKDLPNILESTKNQLLLKLAGEGYRYPVWGVEVTDEAEKQWYMENLVGEVDTKATGSNIRATWNDGDDYYK